MFLANIDVRTSRSRIYIILYTFWYVYLNFEKYISVLLLQCFFCLPSVLSDFSIIRSQLPHIRSYNRGSTVMSLNIKKNSWKISILDAFFFKSTMAKIN